MDELPGKEAEVLAFTEEGRLRHENQYLQKRLQNLEAFKKNFFKANAELELAKQRLFTLEQQLNLDKVKRRISILDESQDTEASSELKENEDILDFLKRSFLTTHYQDLVASMFQSIEGTDLDMTVQISSEEGTLDYALNPDAKEVNIKLLEHYKGQGEFVKTQLDGFVLNLSHIRVFVRNLPVENKIQTEQIKEFVIIVSMAANSRIESLKKEIELETLRRNIYKVFKKTRISFEALQEAMDNQTINISEIFLKFEKDLKDQMENSALPENHMKSLNILLYETKAELNLLLTSSLLVDENFLKAITKLEEMYSIKYLDDD